MDHQDSQVVNPTTIKMLNVLYFSPAMLSEFYFTCDKPDVESERDALVKLASIRGVDITTAISRIEPKLWQLSVLKLM